MRHRQRGLTLIELMLAMTLGMGVTLAALALLQSAKESYLAVDDGAQVQESGRYALEMIARALRQANHVPHDHALLTHLARESLPVGVQGHDNARLAEQTPGITAPSPNPAAQGSDVLAIRFLGAGDMRNCAGTVTAAPQSSHTAALAQAISWNIFYVAVDATGEPELRCKYPTRKGGWSAAAMVRGVESFQVLYGVPDGESGNIVYRNAAQMASRWNEVVAVRVALLVRGAHAAGTLPVVHHLFGPAYAGSSTDQGTVIDEALLPAPLQRRIRNVFTTTVRLRNGTSHTP